MTQIQQLHHSKQIQCCLSYCSLRHIIYFWLIFIWQCPLKSNPWQRYTPPLIYVCIQTDTIERGAKTVGMSIPPPAITESGDRERSSRFQPYNAARGKISREITIYFCIPLLENLNEHFKRTGFCVQNHVLNLCSSVVNSQKSKGWCAMFTLKLSGIQILFIISNRIQILMKYYKDQIRNN